MLKILREREREGFVLSVNMHLRMGVTSLLYLIVMTHFENVNGDGNEMIGSEMYSNNTVIPDAVLNQNQSSTVPDIYPNPNVAPIVSPTASTAPKVTSTSVIIIVVVAACIIVGLAIVIIMSRMKSKRNGRRRRALMGKHIPLENNFSIEGTEYQKFKTQIKSIFQKK